MTEAPSMQAELICPHCDSPGYFCAASNHGVTDGPALHCRRSPAHNAWTEDQFWRWAPFVSAEVTDD